MQHIDRIGTIVWNLLEVLILTLVIFMLIVGILPTSPLAWTIVEYVASLLIAVLINRTWLPIEYRMRK